METFGRKIIENKCGTSIGDRRLCSLSNDRIGHLFRYTHDGKLKVEPRQARTDRCLMFVLRREHWPYTEYHKTYGCSELNSAHRVPRGMHRRISPLCILWSPVFRHPSTESCFWEQRWVAENQETWFENG